MVDILNILIALMTIVFGAFGFLAPRFTASALDLKVGESNMGLSEMRASVGGLFVAMGLFAIWTGLPMAYAMIGVAYTGAALGRLISIFFDAPPFKKTMLYFSLEAGPAAYLLLANL